jgi:uncharacterized zinc-type alcohol dehydrogenase-like protein
MFDVMMNDQKASSALPGTRTAGYAALERNGAIVPWSFERRAVRPQDVALKILFSGICHTDLHSVGKWGQEFPIVPGHEIVGEVTELGSAVTGLSEGDIVTIGTMVDSCRECEPCKAHMESYCRANPTWAYDSIDRVDGTRTRGGFSHSYVADERFVHPLPKGMDLAGAAPLLCAGITTYSPLRHWGAGPGKTVGVIGIGGLGHLGIKMARAMGAHVVAFTTSPRKIEDALRLGAHEAILSTDEAQMKLDGTLCSLGLPDSFDLQPLLLAMGRRSIASSGSGGTRETREMLAFCHQHGITAEVEVIAPKQINEAFARLAKGDVKYRFVLDMARD